MALADKDLSCSECNAAFVFTVGEQEFFNSRGYTDIIRIRNEYQIT